MEKTEIIAAFHPSPQLTTDFESDAWTKAQIQLINRDWSGAPAPPELHTTARVIWSEEMLLLGFECAYTELDVDEQYDVYQERYALWDRDVCEAFIRSPPELHARAYREFEVAPTGQWCDLRLDWATGLKDWEWRSGMNTACEIDVKKNVWRAVMAIPFAAFNCRPQPGDLWQANLFRVSRLNGVRQYLTLSPTWTEKPNFHVAESFVSLRFA
jgi:hypothetical protein